MKYIVYYDVDKSENRKFVLSAKTKIDYICKAFNSLKENVELVSVSETLNKKFYKGRIVKLNSNILRLFSTIPSGNALLNRVSQLYVKLNLFFYLIRTTKEDEIIVVYHGTAYGNTIHLAKKLNKFKICLEVEEIYQDVRSLGDRKNKREYRDFKEADMYIFPTKLLNDKINLENKPYAIIHGTYQVEKDRQVSFNDGNIHVVYAGTFDPRKGGAAAAAAAEYLPENYHVHIIGFGSKKDTEYIRNVIDSINAKSRASVTYDGLLSGEEYIQFLQKCQIGLSPQNPNAEFNATSFPSKILSYMANGLRVVTIRIPAIETSDIGRDVYYYDKQEPKEIAQAIMSIDFNDGYDGRSKIKNLDKKFSMELKTLLG